MGATRPKFSREFKLRARTTAEVTRRATPLIRPDFARSHALAASLLVVVRAPSKRA